MEHFGSLTEVTGCFFLFIFIFRLICTRGSTRDVVGRTPTFVLLSSMLLIFGFPRFTFSDTWVTSVFSHLLSSDLLLFFVSTLQYHNVLLGLILLTPCFRNKKGRQKGWHRKANRPDRNPGWFGSGSAELGSSRGGCDPLLVSLAWAALVLRCRCPCLGQAGLSCSSGGTGAPEKAAEGIGILCCALQMNPAEGWVTPAWVNTKISYYFCYYFYC